MNRIFTLLVIAAIVALIRISGWQTPPNYAASLAVANATDANASDAGISLVSTDALTRAIRDARTVDLAAYTLTPGMATTRALIDAADRGAKVSVQLDGFAFGEAERWNRETLPLLRSHGISAKVTQQELHLKAAIVDGVPYLSDRNFARGGITVRDDIPEDRPVIVGAMHGAFEENDHLWMTKASAVVHEARVLSTRSTRYVKLSSESFGCGTPVYDQLRSRAELGDQVRVLVTQREFASTPAEQTCLRDLANLGVYVRVGTSNDKLALDGDDIWVGSANATAGVGEQIEWGLAMRSSVIAAAARQEFERQWQMASPAF